MSDDKATPGRPDRDPINLEQDCEVRDRCKSLGVSEKELGATVRTADKTVPKVQTLTAHSTPGYQTGRLGRIVSALRSV
jgi:hypothetical protein